MTKKIVQEITNQISFIPGIMGFASMEFKKRPSILSEAKWEEAIQTEEVKNGLVVKIAVVIDFDVTTKNISEEIKSSLKVVLTKNKIKLKKAIIYIRGVK